MNQLKNLKYNDSLMQRLFGDGQRVISKMLHDTPRTYYDTTTNKWMVQNNTGVYEEWGVMPTVATLEGVTTYKGKLVLCNGHEYKWNGSEWTDLGTGTIIPVGWLTVDANCSFNTGLIIRNIYATNAYIKEKHTAIASGIGYFFGGGTSPWFTCEKYNSSTQYWNLANTTLFGSGVVTPFLSTASTSGWAAAEVNGTTATVSNSTGQTYSRTISWQGTNNVHFNILSDMVLSSLFRGQFHNLAIYNTPNGDPIHNYYATANNGTPCLYDAVTGTYLYNQVASPATQPTFTQTGTLPGGVPEEYPAQPVTAFFRLADSFSVINPHWNYNVSATEEIVDNIATASPSLPNVWDKTTSKWYIKNNLNTYEEWGVMPTVESLEDVTTYTGKLVLCGGHEYKWNGTEWTDLGTGTSVIDYITINDGGIGLDYQTVVIKTGYRIQCKVNPLPTQGQYIGCLQTNGLDLPDSNDFRIFSYGNSIYYDCGNSRYIFNRPSNDVFECEYGLYYVKDLATGNYIFNQGSKTLSLASNACFWIGRLVDFGFDMYYCKVYDENNTLLLNLVPAIENGVYGFRNLVDNTFNGRSGITGHYKQDIPEHYPTRQPATPTVSKTSYNAVIGDSYMNGQIVTVYGTNYDVVNGRLVRQQEPFEAYPLGFRAYEGSVTLSMSYGTSAAASSAFPDPVFYTSTDRQKWTAWSSPSSTSIFIPSGTTLYIKGIPDNTNRISRRDNRIYSRQFVLSGSGKVDLIGQITSLFTDDWTTPLAISAPLADLPSTSSVRSGLRYIFENNTNIYNAENLHFNIASITATGGGNYLIYTGDTFQGCTNLGTGAQWDVKTTVTGKAAFISQYNGCTNLRKATLPWCDNVTNTGRTLETLFNGCARLTEIYYKGVLPLTTEADQSNNMMRYVGATGTFHNIGQVEYDNTAYGIISTWTVTEN